MVPFLSLICKEFEPPAPYDTTVEFMLDYAIYRAPYYPLYSGSSAPSPNT